MPKTYMLACDIFDIWVIDFVGPFLTSKGCNFILVVIDCLSKWVEAQATMFNDSRAVIKFMKKLFTWFAVPKVLISDQGKHFKNQPVEKLLAKYGVQH